MGIGIDVVDVARMADLLEKHGDRFQARCFRPGESSGKGEGVEISPESEFFAGRWAAKEAFLKALGRDVKGIPYRDIEVLQASTGKMPIMLHGRAAAALAREGGRHIHLSISLDGGFAVASVVLES